MTIAQGKKRVIHTWVSEEVYKIIRRKRIEEDLSVRQILEQAVTLLAREASPQPQESSWEGSGGLSSA